MIILKEKIFIFIGGLLLGAIISTSSIYFYTVANSKNEDETKTQETRMPNGDRPQMQQGEMGGNGTPPEMPSNEDTQKE